MIIEQLAKFVHNLNDHRGGFFYFDESAQESYFGYSNLESNIINLFQDQVKNNSEDDLRDFDLSDKNLRGVDESSFMTKNNLRTLDLSLNELESISKDTLANCVKLEGLNLTRAFLPHAKFSMSFLDSVGGLKTLELTLPDAPIDLECFKNLKNLEMLILESASSMDANLKYPLLTTENLNYITKTHKNLKKLKLSYFEIEKIDSDTLEGFS